MRIYLGNMPYSMDEAGVRELFGAYGEVSDVNIITDRETGRPRGFAFVEIANDDSAQKAIEALHEHVADGRPLNVNQARPKEDRQRRDRW